MACPVRSSKSLLLAARYSHQKYGKVEEASLIKYREFVLKLQFLIQFEDKDKTTQTKSSQSTVLF